jgi:hypothetical protein
VPPPHGTVGSSRYLAHDDISEATNSDDISIRTCELLDFSKSCLPESTAMRNFNKVEFSDTISIKSASLRYSDIHNPSLRFLHRWMSFTLFPMVELCSVTTAELKCLFAMVNRIKYTNIADIVDYFTNVSKISCNTPSYKNPN